MRAFIDEAFWSDPGVEELGPEEKLSILWLITNSKRDLCGFTEISHRRFCFDTGLKVEALQRALQGLGKGFVVPMKGFIWSRNFVAHQLGRGLKLQRNNITKSVVKHLVSLPPEFQELFLEEYPELEALAKGLQSPCQGERKEKGKGKVKRKAKNEIPSVEEVIEEMKVKLPQINNEWTPCRITKATRLKYETCVENGWKDGNGNAISNWKLKFVNMMKFEKPWTFGKDETPHKIQPNMQL
jgi:hypothetical protein